MSLTDPSLTSGILGNSPILTPSLLAEMQRLIDEPSEIDRGEGASGDWQDLLRQLDSCQRLSEGDQGTSRIQPPGRETPLQLGRFELLSVLGSGGFGIVFRALDRTLDRQVALKVLRPEAANSPTLCERFLREAKAAAQLEHPGIVPIHGLGVDSSGHPFFAMRFVQGESLGRASERFHAEPHAGQRYAEWSLRLRKLLTRFVSICQTIEYAHSRGVVHRDLKPDNIMLGEFGETLVVDWGMAKCAATHGPPDAIRDEIPDESVPDYSSPMTQKGAILGTPAYMSPEQAAGSGDLIGPASDIYSLGATLFVILTGQAPTPHGQQVEVADDACRSHFRSSREIDRRIPRALDAICRKAMAKEPHNRYPSARALADDVELWLAGSAVSAWRESLWLRAARWVAQHRTIATGLAAALLVAVLSSLVANQFISANRRRHQVEALVRRIESAELQALPALLEEIEPVRSQSIPLLRQTAARSTPASRPLLNIQLALLPSDSSQLPDLTERLLSSQPKEFLVLRQLLRPQSSSLAPVLWKRWKAHADDRQTVLRIAAVLAAYDADAPEWAQYYDELADLVVLENLLVLRVWIEALQPLGNKLQAPLLRILARNPEKPEGRVAAEFLAAYSQNAEFLVDLLTQASPSQLPPIVRQLTTLPGTARPLLTAVLNDLTLPHKPNLADDLLTPTVTRDRIRARAAVALFALGEYDEIWQLLTHTADPTFRSQIINLFAPAQIDAQVLMDRWPRERNSSRRRALLLILGNFHPSAFIPSQRQIFLGQVRATFRTDPDSGVHSAAEWLLEQWGEHQFLQDARRELGEAAQISADRRWLVNHQGQTFAVIPGPVEFLMGSPAQEWQRVNTEQLHRRRIDRSFAISTREITVAEYARLATREHPTVGSHVTADPDCPAGFIRWFQAARYCRRLSEREGITEDQQCFPPEDQIGPGMRLPDDYLHRTGYRLPTAAEWEYACRAGTISRTSFGNDRRPSGCARSTGEPGLGIEVLFGSQRRRYARSPPFGGFPAC